MNKLINFELRKLRKTKSFYNCIIIASVLAVLNALILKSVSDTTGVLYDAASYSLKFTNNAMLTLIIGIFTAIFVTEDFSGGTIKNIYAKGYSRNVVYMSKYIVSTVSALIIVITSLLMCVFVSNALFKGEAVENSTFASSLLLQMLLIVAYNSLYFLISIIVGKLGSSIALIIVGPSMVSLVLTLADSFLNIQNVKFNDYWLENCLSSVQVINCSNSIIVSSLVVSMAVIIVSLVVGTKLHSKKEI
ncbi:MAG: ABC transporter permease [Lachnospira sp.]